MQRPVLVSGDVGGKVSPKHGRGFFRWQPNQSKLAQAVVIVQNPAVKVS